MTCILGLNAFHGDSSACLVVDGHLVAAAEEERFRRVKHWAGFPSEAIRYCLQEGGQVGQYRGKCREVALFLRFFALFGASSCTPPLEVV